MRQKGRGTGYVGRREEEDGASCSERACGYPSSLMNVLHMGELAVATEWSKEMAEERDWVSLPLSTALKLT